MAGSFAEFRYGWPVVFASAIGIGLGMSPLPFYTIGVFAGPLIGEFGWGQGDVMFGLAIFATLAVLTSPVIGILTDRFGPRRVVLVSIVLFGITMMSFSLLTGSRIQYLATWGLLAMTGSGTLPITWTRAVNGWFFERRGLALGLALVGTGIFGIVAKNFAFTMIDAVGWRMAYVAVGALPLVIAWPIAFFMFRDITDSKVAGKVAEMKRADVGPKVIYGGLSLRQAVTDWRFWLLAYSFIPISMAVGGPIPNLEAIMAEKGFSPADAVTLASLIGIAVIIGRIGGGALVDHFWAPAVAAIILSSPAIAVWMLAQAELSFVAAAIGIFILGMAAGVEYDLMAYLVSRYFGLRNYASIYGFLYGFFAIGAGIGPAIFGYFFDRTQTYDTILMISALLFIAGALPLLLLGRYRDFTEPLPEGSADNDN